MNSIPKNCISGLSHDEQYFNYYTSQDIQFSEILRALKGEKLGCIFKKVVPDFFCDTIYENAFNDKERIEEKLAKVRTDEAPPVSVGTQHYKKYLDHYLDESERVLPELQNLFKSIDIKNNFYDKFTYNFSNFLEKYDIKYQLAEHKGRAASPFWVRAFDAQEEFALKPHEDVPQLRCPKQAGFEIQSVKTIIAVNICLKNENDGMLIHYNLQPDDNMRKALGIEDTGYPYPLSVLEKIPRIELETRKGDFYFLNANNIHAVRVPRVSDRLRTTMSWFMGFKDDKTILYWI